MLLLLLLLLLILTILWIDSKYHLYCEQKIIPGISQAGFKYPIIGSLLNLGKSQALTYSNWAARYGPVFQIRLGCKRAVVVNDYESVKELWIDNMTANCSRPISYTFHHVVSASQGFTIGTTPWGNTYKRKRKVAGRALNKPAVKSYLPFIDKESAWCINSMQYNEDIDVRSFFRTYALNCGLSVNYGTRLDMVDKDLLKEICTVEKKIGQFRASLDNFQDFLPFLRLLFPSVNKEAIDVRKRRDWYMNILLNNLRREIEDGQAIPCIAGSILKNQETSKITEQDLKSICLTMVSAGLDTAPAALIYFMGYMSQPENLNIQSIAYQSLFDHYGTEDKDSNVDLWDECLANDQCEYIKAIVNETLRMSAMPISLPRETVKDIYYNNTIIPKGTRLIMNTYAANFDTKIYPNAKKFDPSRYLNWKKGKPKHFAFGAGTRMCAGVSLAERQLYTAICRLILKFEILPPSNYIDLMPTDPEVLFQCQTSLVVEPPPFKVFLRRR